jgi:hypothetical protein
MIGKSASRKRIATTVFVVPYMANGQILKIRVYSNAAAAQRALRRYVNYSQLLREVKRKHPNVDRKRAMLYAYGAITRTAYAGTDVYEVQVDSRLPVVRRSRRKPSS